MYKYQVALPPFPRFSSQTAPSWRKRGAPPTGQDPQRIPAQCSARRAGRGQEEIPPLLPCSFPGCGRGDPACAPGGPRPPALAPSFFGSTRRLLCLTDSSHPPNSRLPLVG